VSTNQSSFHTPSAASPSASPYGPASPYAPPGSFGGGWSTPTYGGAPQYGSPQYGGPASRFGQQPGSPMWQRMQQLQQQQQGGGGGGGDSGGGGGGGDYGPSYDPGTGAQLVSPEDFFGGDSMSDADFQEAAAEAQMFDQVESQYTSPDQFFGQ
jgi:hypothetical protein